MCMRHVLAVAVLLASFSEDFPVLYTSRHVFNVFNVFFWKFKKRYFLRFFALLHTFSQTMLVTISAALSLRHLLSSAFYYATAIYRYVLTLPLRRSHCSQQRVATFEVTIVRLWSIQTLASSLSTPTCLESLSGRLSIECWWSTGVVPRSPARLVSPSSSTLRSLCRNDLYYVGWGVTLCSLTRSLASTKCADDVRTTS